MIIIFFRTGRQYDKNGNLAQWWPDQAIADFKERAQCIINQYGNYTVPEADMKVCTESSVFIFCGSHCMFSSRQIKMVLVGA
jgi:predicted metalloendopeptidase